MTVIDVNTWERKAHFELFRNADVPHYHMGADLDITRFKEHTGRQNLPFTFAVMHAVVGVLNGIEEMCQRIEGDKVVCHSVLHPYFAYKSADKKYFKMVLAPYCEDIAAFCQMAQQKAQTQEEYFVKEDIAGRSDLVFTSSVPHVTFTHVSHTASKDDAIPRVTWGKFYTDHKNRLMMPVNIQVHHAFVDGDHVGRFFGELQAYFDANILIATI
jgi:chloramphenicol O-acetyltransferase type A